jgi:hypothetical protein
MACDILEVCVTSVIRELHEDFIGSQASALPQHPNKKTLNAVYSTRTTGKTTPVGCQSP